MPGVVFKNSINNLKIQRTLTNVKATEEILLQPFTCTRVPISRTGEKGKKMLFLPTSKLEKRGLYSPEGIVRGTVDSVFILNKTGKTIPIAKQTTLGGFTELTPEGCKIEPKKQPTNSNAAQEIPPDKQKVGLYSSEWTHLIPGEEIPVWIKPVGESFDSGKIIPSTKWDRRNVQVSTRKLKKGEQMLIFRNNRKGSQTIPPDELLGYVIVPKSATPGKVNANASKQSVSIKIRRADEANENDDGEKMSNSEFLKKIKFGKISGELAKKFTTLLLQRRKAFAKNDDHIPEAKNFEYRIPVKPNIQPVRKKSIRFTGEQEEAMEMLTRRLLKAGVIQNCPFSPHCARAFVVPKKEKKSWRLVVDLSEMGRNIYDDNYPTMPLNRARDILSRAKFITKMDIKDAYFSVKLAPESRKLTAFAVNTPGLRGLYEFTRAPQGLKCSGQALARLLGDTIGDLARKGVYWYADDLFIATEDTESQYELIDEVLKRFEERGIAISPEKTSILLSEDVECLGFTFTCPGVKADSRKLDAIIKAPEPATLRQMRRFYGQICFFKDHIKDFKTLVHPIEKLLSPKLKSQKPFLMPEAREAIQNASND